MNCPFNEIKMNDDEFISKLNSQSSEFKESNNLQFFENKISNETNKSCACSDKNSNNILSKNKLNELKSNVETLFEKFIFMFKNIANENDIYKAVSVYEFYLSILLIFLIISTQNTYLGILLLGLYSRHIPELIIKLFVSKKGDELRKWAKRPDGAMNCNMFNSGGDMSKDSGMISSHTFLISSLMFYLIFKFTDNLKKNMNYKQYLLVILLLIWTLIVTVSRIKLGCHKQHQTLLGFVFGIIWGYLMYLIIEIIKNRVSRVAEDEEKVLKIFEI